MARGGCGVCAVSARRHGGSARSGGGAGGFAGCESGCGGGVSAAGGWGGEAGCPVGNVSAIGEVDGGAAFEQRAVCGDVSAGGGADGAGVLYQGGEADRRAVRAVRRGCGLGGADQAGFAEDPAGAGSEGVAPRKPSVFDGGTRGYEAGAGGVSE